MELTDLNEIGIAALTLFVAGWLGAAVSFFAFNLPRVMKEHSSKPLGVWSDAKGRGRFLIFLSFCALGPLAALIGFIFGGWPTS